MNKVGIFKQLEQHSQVLNQDETILLIKNRFTELNFIKKKNQTLLISRNSIPDFTILQSLTLTYPQQFITSRIKQVYLDKYGCFIVLQFPFEIYFGSQHSKTLIKVNLQMDFNFKNSQITIDDGYIYIYGHNQVEFWNKLISINLMNLQIKILCDGKGYSPRARNKFHSIFSEQRMYVFGGKNKQNVQYQPLLWTFDLQKNNWFALQMVITFQINQQPMKCLLKSGKVIMLQKSKDNYLLRLIELYQSKATQFKIISQIPNYNTILQKAKGIFAVNDNIWLYGQNSFCLGIIQISQNKHEQIH